MRIQVQCPNGHSLKVKQELAGRTIRCPACQAEIEIPQSSKPEAAEAAGQEESPAGRDPSSADDGETYAIQSRVPNTPPQPTGEQQVSSTPPGPPKRKKKKTAPPPAEPETSDSRNRSWMIVAGAGTAAVLLIAILIWISTGSNDEAEPPVQNVAQSNPSPVSPPEHSGPATSIPAETSELTQPPAPPLEQTTPVDDASPRLVQFELDPRLDAFRLPAPTWGFAYDEQSGRLALTNDERGILIYEFHQAGKDRLKPIAEFPTAGLPTAVCWKPLGDRRVFVFAEEKQPRLQVVDVETLKVVDTIELEHLNFAGFLTGSPNPDDPYVYFVHQTYNPQFELTKDRESSNRIGRVNLTDKSQDSSTSNDFTDLTVSEDGSTVFLRPNSTADGIIMRWGNRGASAMTNIGQWPRNGFSEPIYRLNHRLAVKRLVVSPSFKAGIKYLDYSPYLEFRKRPIVMGLSDSEIVIGSGNDLRRLAAIPLPANWRRSNRRADPADMRLRYQLSPYFQSSFFDVAADEQRGIGLFCFSDRLIAVPLQKFQLPGEPPLVIRKEVPHVVNVGESLEIPLQPGSPGVRFEFVRSNEGLPKIDRRTARVLGAKSELQDSLNTIPLDAAVFDKQNIVYIGDLSKLNGKTLPLKIQIDDEIMTVTEVDDFKGALIVERTNPQRHSVSSPIRILGQEDNEPKIALPEIEQNTFRWTPGADQVGRHLVRMRATRGKTVYEWFWEFEVRQNYHEFPFFLTGIEPQADSTLAVVWGQQHPPSQPVNQLYNLPASPEDGKYYLGLYDSSRRELIRQVEISQRVSMAVMDPSGVYVALNQIDPQKPTSVAATRLVRFDPASLEEQQSAELKMHPSRLTLIGGKYLVADARRRGLTQQFNLTDLTPVDTGAGPYPFPIAGRVGTGHIWDGVLWDPALEKARLLIFPVHLLQRPGGPDAIEIGADKDVNVTVRMSGATACLAAPMQRIKTAACQLSDPDVSLECVGGKLNLYSSINPFRINTHGFDRPPDASVVLMDPFAGVTTVTPLKTRSQIADRFNGYVAAAGGQIFVALQGKLFEVPLSRLIAPEPAFRFQEQQETFVLEAEKPNKVHYSAPGATGYRMTCWLNLPVFDEPPELRLESDDGEFEIQFENPARFTHIAISNALSMHRTTPPPEQPLAVLEEHAEQIGPVLKKLTGRKPQGLPVPVYVVVTATHPDGVQRAGLFHCYLIDVPMKDIRKEAQSSNLRGRRR